MWGVRPWLLAALFAVLGAGAWWLFEPPPEPDDERAPRPRQPDHVVTQFTAIETDESGRPERRLVAATLRHFVAEDLTELELPRLSLYQTEGPPWQVEAQSGLLLEGGAQVQLENSVRVHRAAAADAESVTLITEALTLWPKRQFAEGDRAGAPRERHRMGDGQRHPRVVRQTGPRRAPGARQPLPPARAWA